MRVLHARGILNKKNVMEEDTDPHVIGITDIRQSIRSYEQTFARTHKTRVCMHISGVNKTYETRLDY